MSFFGVIICAISVGIFKIAASGVDPFQSFMAGLDALIPVNFGTLYVIANVVLLAFALIFDRHYIGIATFINLFLLGYITQFTYEFLHRLIVDPAIWVRIICLVVGIIIICFGSALFLVAGGSWKAIPTIAGVGTIITAFFMGPLIEFFNVKCARPFLDRARSDSNSCIGNDRL